MSYLLNAQSVHLFFQDQVCFEDFSAPVYDGDHIALIGDNGSGKTSLLRCLIGDLKLSSGVVLKKEGLSIGFLNQGLISSQCSTVQEILLNQIAHWISKLDELEKISLELASSRIAQQDYDALFEELLAADAFNMEHDIEELLEQMHLSRYKETQVQHLSGGEQMRLKLASLLILKPDLLILDEPTNHLDQESRNWLFDFLNHWKKAAIIVTHDLDLLSFWPDQIWNIKRERVSIFKGSYTSFLDEEKIKKNQLEAKRSQLLDAQDKRRAFIEKNRENKAKKSRQSQKKYDGDKMMRRAKKEQAEDNLSSHRELRVHRELEQATEDLKGLKKTKELIPKFYYSNPEKPPCSLRVENGKVGFEDKWILNKVNFSLEAYERVALVGANGSGKTLLMRALMEDSTVKREGIWEIPTHMHSKVGYLDQHYTLLDPHKTVDEMIQEKNSKWDLIERQKHMQSFLFLDFRILNRMASDLSGGEKARLCLALIAIKAPSLLILDEATNNLDLKTKTQLAELLKVYKGSLLVNSHERSFLEAIGIERMYSIAKRELLEIAVTI